MAPQFLGALLRLPPPGNRAAAALAADRWRLLTGRRVEGPEQCYRPLATSHSFTVPSLLAEARVLPSGAQATLITSERCPWRVRSSWPLAASQSFSVATSPPEASTAPSGAQATLFTLFTKVV